MEIFLIIKDIKNMFKYTNCDAVMIARASLGNPWFFKVAKAGLKNDPLPPLPLY